MNQPVADENNTEALEQKRKIFSRVDTIRFIESITRFILAALFSGGKIFVPFSPFTASLTAAAGGSAAGVFTLLGGILGYFFAGSLIFALKYIAISFLICVAAFVFRDTEVSYKVWFMPAVAAFMTLCTGFVYAADAGWTSTATTLLFTETVLAGGCAYFYKIALSPWSGRLNFEEGAEIQHTVSVLLFISTLLISLSGVRLFGFISFGRILASLTIFLVAFKCGVGMGCATGISIGLAMDSAADRKSTRLNSSHT